MISGLMSVVEGLLVDTPSYRGFRFPPEIISHCVWLYHRFNLSLRDVEELMLERGVLVSYETIHQWTHRFGPAYAAALRRRRRPKPADKWLYLLARVGPPVRRVRAPRGAGCG
jgi:putative transposase